MAYSSVKMTNNIKLSEINKHILDSKFSKSIISSAINNGELSLTVESSLIVKFITWLRDDKKCRFKMLISICGVDYPSLKERFEIVYNLLSLTNNKRIRIKVLADTETLVPSISDVFGVAGWYEREIWDMYGVYFAKHKDLRRIITDYGFEGHPLRKDFPLTGFTEVRYDIEKKKVVNDSVVLTQEFRNFDFISPWAGPEFVLPGDEKATK
jgi:NADH-quinone oxidoreductase subunit C